MLALSIIILTYNGAALTLACLESLYAGVGQRDDIEVIVVDNGKDDSIAILKSEVFRNFGDRIKIVTLNSNRGVSYGRNVGLKNCSDSRYFMFLDNDTIVAEDSVERLIGLMDSHPDTGIAGPCLVSADGQIQKSFKAFPGILEKARNIISGRSAVVDLLPGDDVIYPFYIIGACQIFRREVFEKVGFLDENIFFGPEDADYCMRVRNAGYKVAYFPSVRITHHWQRTSRKSPLSATSLRHFKALFYFYKKWRKFI